MSSLCSPVSVTLLSGVPRMINRPITETATQARKIERQPKACVIAPPNSSKPPQEPMDHMLIARWRSAPSQ